MIKSFEELGEVLADFEVRLSVLENSQHFHEPKEVLLEPQEIIHRHINYNSDVSKKQWQRIDAISGELTYLRNKEVETLNELNALKSKKKKSKYD